MKQISILLILCILIGSFTTSVTAETSDNEYILGGTGTDYVPDMFLYLMIKSIYFGTYEATENELARADFNGDGEIDMFDYLEVKAIYFEQ